MTSFQSIKQTCDHGQMPDGCEEYWSSPHDECLALAASITYHMYQLPDRKPQLQAGSVTQGYYIAQFLVMPSYNSTERRKFFSFTHSLHRAKGSASKALLLMVWMEKAVSKAEHLALCRPPAEQEIQFVLQEIQFCLILATDDFRK